MQRLVLAAILSMTAFDAWAIVRYMVQDMTCDEIRAAVERDGAAILYRKGGAAGTLYDRYVRDGSLCGAGKETSRDSVPAADTGRCPVQKCVDRNRFGD